MERSRVHHNHGDGIDNNGVMTITDSLVTENRLSGIFNSGTLTVTRTVVSDQREGRGSCAGVVNVGTLTMFDSAIRDNDTNYPGGDGGGLCNMGERARATLVNTSILDNEASFEFDGGGIYNYEGQVVASNTTISGNQATHGGGIANDGGQVALYNTTVSGNQATSPFSSVTTSGGGIMNVAPGTVTLHNSLVATNTSTDGAPDCDGTLVSAGYNLVGTTDGCTVAAEGDQYNVAAGLGPRRYDWAYQPLVPGSRAIDAGDPAGCRGPDGQTLDTDQRGIARVGRCDIGAYEYDMTTDPLSYQWLPLVQTTR